MRIRSKQVGKIRDTFEGYTTKVYERDSYRLSYYYFGDKLVCFSIDRI